VHSKGSLIYKPKLYKQLQPLGVSGVFSFIYFPSRENLKNS